MGEGYSRRGNHFLILDSDYRWMMRVYMGTRTVRELRNGCIWCEGFARLDAWMSVGVSMVVWTSWVVTLMGAQDSVMVASR